MKIIVFSDSHGCVSAMADVVMREKPDMIFHLGDCWEDAQRLTLVCPDIPLEQVPGNCDYRPREVQERILTLCGHKLLLCHGHTLRVKSGFGGAIAAGRRLGAEAVFFGHTHNAWLEEQDGLWLMNPGTMGYAGKQSYGRVLLDEKGMKLKLCELEKSVR